MSMDIGALQNDYIDIGALQFTPPTTIAFSGNVNLFIHGFTSQTDNLDLIIIGHESLTANIDLFIPGKDLITDQFTLFISSINVFSATTDLFIHGFTTKNNNLDLFIFHSEPINSNINLFIYGKDYSSELLNLIVFNLEPIVNNLNLFIKGPIQIIDYIDLFIKGPILEENNLDLFISGYVESVLSTLFLKTSDNNIATSISLHIYGSPSGVDLNFAGQELDLFIKSSLDDSIYPPVISGYTSLFMPVASGNTSGSGYWPLFLASNTSVDGNIDLYISTNEKFITKGLNLFIRRIPDFPGQEGYTPINIYNTLFLKTQDGAQRDLALSISGVPGPVNGNVDCFIKGLSVINDNLNLVLYGITGDIFDNINLYMYGIDRPTDLVTLFVRGW